MLSAPIKKYNIDVDMLRLKIAETAFAEQSREIIEKVAQPTEFGHVVEIDYFGSGYSSLNTLKDVPTSVLKIDMRFFESAESNHRAGNIIESVVRMAKLLDMAVIAEARSCTARRCRNIWMKRAEKFSFRRLTGLSRRAGRRAARSRCRTAGRRSISA